MSGRKGAPQSAATTFRRDEILFLEELFNTLLRGGDPDILLRRKAFRTLFAKVVKMKSRVKAVSAKGET